MTEERFLQQFIFYGLQNQNHGVDAISIKHFFYEDFEVVMDRVEQHCVTILGIECWYGNRLIATRYIEDYMHIHNWHRHAAAELNAKIAYICVFAATYEVPEKLLY